MDASSTSAAVTSDAPAAAHKEQARERRRRQIERDMHVNFNRVLDALMVDFDTGMPLGRMLSV